MLLRFKFVLVPMHYALRDDFFSQKKIKKFSTFAIFWGICDRPDGYQLFCFDECCHIYAFIYIYFIKFVTKTSNRNETLLKPKKIFSKYLASFFGCLYFYFHILNLFFSLEDEVKEDRSDQYLV